MLDKGGTTKKLRLTRTHVVLKTSVNKLHKLEYNRTYRIFAANTSLIHSDFCYSLHISEVTSHSGKFSAGHGVISRAVFEK
jgi:hypothetical protein